MKTGATFLPDNYEVEIVFNFRWDRGRGPFNAQDSILSVSFEKVVFSKKVIIDSDTRTFDRRVRQNARANTENVTANALMT